MDDARRWAEKFRNRTSILKIAREEGADPGTVSAWLKKAGIEVAQGQHFARQPPLKLSAELTELVIKGPAAVRTLVEHCIWGVRISPEGASQLEKFCEFVRFHAKGGGVEEIANGLGLHRSTILEWRNGSDKPYTVKLAEQSVRSPPHSRWMWLPLRVDSGGNDYQNWIEVPPSIATYSEVVDVLNQIRPLEGARARSASFGMNSPMLEGLNAEMFAYLLGFMLGDASKLGGSQERMASVNLDLQLSTKELTNERLGEFVCTCANNLGLGMERKRNKEPSGSTRFGRDPSEAFRWASERSPFLAWMYSVCLGLEWSQRTSYDPVKMDWIFSAPAKFRQRFTQALADSDGSVKKSEVVITSVPNAEFVTRLLESLGMVSAHTIHEQGKSLRSMVSRREAASLPIFNEFVKGYRYVKLMSSGHRTPDREELPKPMPSRQPSQLGPSE